MVMNIVTPAIKDELKQYTDAKSPIRRYADVIVHRMLDSVLTARKLTRARSWDGSLPVANQNDVKFLMDRDQVAKISQQCNMKKGELDHVRTSGQHS